MKLIICEKPAQARDIANFLKLSTRKNSWIEGCDYIVTWCIGHLLELAPPAHYKPDISPWHIDKLPIVPSVWKRLVSVKTKSQFEVIKTLLAKTQHVIVASDPDREGECIVREILDECHYQGVIERLWLNALDEHSIAKAFANIRPGYETENLYHAADVRGKCDYLIGMNMTMAMSALYGVNSVLSIGRVQTPTLQLVVERDGSIEGFKPHDYYVLKVLFEHKTAKPFYATWQAHINYLNSEKQCVNKSIIESIAAKVDGEPGTVKSYREEELTKPAPLCLSLSELQKQASRIFGYTAKQTLEISQALYDTHKATTYPKTDSGYLPEEQFAEARQILATLAHVEPNIAALIGKCDPELKSRVWNNQKVSAHHGIIPTLNDKVYINKMSAEEYCIYDLIRRHYFCQFMGDYAYKHLTLEIGCAGEIFVATANAVTRIGWKEAFADNIENDAIENVSTALPILSVGDNLQNQETMIESKKTKPPLRFTEGTLIEAMKTVGHPLEDITMQQTFKRVNGIGTEATRANILEILFNRGYLERNHKQVVSTEKGRALIAMTPAEIKNPTLTAEWEQKLEAIAEGKANVDHFLKAQADFLNGLLTKLKNNHENNEKPLLQLRSETSNGKVYLCPNCAGALRRLTNKKGTAFWGCSNYPNCNFTAWEKGGKPNILKNK